MASCPTWRISALNVAVGFFHFKSGVGQALADFTRDHNRTMMASGAAEGDGEIAFAFANVVRNQVDQQLRDEFDELHRLREGSDVARHSGVTAGELFEFRNEIGRASCRERV